MRVQIDTNAKTIKVDENVKFSELIKVLNKLLPKEWKDYTLEASGVWYWYNSIPWTWNEPWRVGDVTYRPSITCEPEHGMTNGTVASSVYNIEVLN